MVSFPFPFKEVARERNGLRCLRTKLEDQVTLGLHFLGAFQERPLVSFGGALYERFLFLVSKFQILSHPKRFCLGPIGFSQFWSMRVRSGFVRCRENHPNPWKANEMDPWKILQEIIARRRWKI